MRSYTPDISRILKSGLRPSEHIKGNGKFLSFVENMQPYIDKLVAPAKVTRFAELNDDADIFCYAIGTYIITASKMYQRETDGSLTVLLNSLPAGGRWFGADFGQYVVFGNGSCYLIRNPNTGVFAVDLGIIFPLAGSLARFRGRLLLGNIKTGEFTGLSSLMWSDIGRAEFVKTGDLDTNRKNTSGQSYLYRLGEILSIYNFSDSHFVVYGTKGICVVTPKSVSGAAGAMDFNYIADYGTATQYTAIETDRGHYYITPFGRLRMLFYKQGALTDDELDFREYIDTTAKLSWSKKDEELVIGIPPTSPFSTGKSYLLNRFGMGSISSYIRAIGERGSQFLVHLPSGAKQLDALFTTDILDFDSPGIKEIGFLEIFGTIPDSMYVAVSYRVDRSTAWSYTDWKRVNQYGVVYLGSAGTEFKIHIAILDYTTISITSIKPTVTFVDRRFTVGMRGAVNDSNSETNP